MRIFLFVCGLAMCVGLTSCGRKPEATTTVQISSTPALPAQRIIETFQVNADRSTSIEQVPETDLFKISVVADTMESAKAKSEILIPKMKATFQKVYPDAKFIIWEQP